MNDWELIARYVVHGDDDAFATLVRRHLEFVHASARRQVGPDLAPDVAQAVFLVLARKASSMKPDVVLSSWLFRTTRFVAAGIRKSEGRRLRREGEAVFMETTGPKTSVQPALDGRVKEELERHLDDAVAALSEVDRGFVLTRFFERQRFGEVAKRFGVSEEAAKKRVNRAVDRMRAFLLARGVSVAPVALAAWLLEPRAEAVPLGLAGAIGTAVGRGLGNAGTSAAGTKLGSMVSQGLRGWRWTQIRHALRVGVCLLGVAWWVGPRILSWGNRNAAASPGTIEAVAAVAPPASAQPEPRSIFEPREGRELQLTLLSEGTDSILVGALVRTEFRRGSDLFEGGDFRSDSQGRCRIRIPSDPVDDLRVTASAIGHVPATFLWQAHELRRGSIASICRLAAGARLGGWVRNEGGDPVAGAMVMIKGNVPRPPGERAMEGYSIEVRTDSTGRFDSREVPMTIGMDRRPYGAVTCQVDVDHPEYLVQHRFLLGAGEVSTNLEFVLKPVRRGYTLRGQVVDPQGVPVAGAEIDSDGQTHRTDSLGVFELVDAGVRNFFPVVYFQVRAAGFAEYLGVALLEEEKSLLHFNSDGVDETPVEPGLEPTIQTRTHRLLAPIVPGVVDSAIHVRIRLSEPREPEPAVEEPRSLPPKESWVRLTGRVLDEASGEPVRAFRVMLGEVGRSGAMLLGDARDGVFDWELSIPIQEAFTITVLADGYVAQGQGPRSMSEADRPFEFRLRNAETIRGWVETPEGRSAVGAWITLKTPGAGVRLGPDQRLDFARATGPRVLAGRDGDYVIERPAQAESLIFVHPSGWAVSPAWMARDTIVRLTAWATIEGEAKDDGDGASAAGRTVSIRSETPGDGARTLPYEASGRADASGRFRFDRVPEGAMRVQLVGMGSDAGKSLRVETWPGRVARVVFGPGADLAPAGKEPVPLSGGN